MSTEHYQYSIGNQSAAICAPPKVVERLAKFPEAHQRPRANDTNYVFAIAISCRMIAKNRTGQKLNRLAGAE